MRSRQTSQTSSDFSHLWYSRSTEPKTRADSVSEACIFDDTKRATADLSYMEWPCYSPKYTFCSRMSSRCTFLAHS